VADQSGCVDRLADQLADIVVGGRGHGGMS
jgi:hypothetical protein